MGVRLTGTHNSLLGDEYKVEIIDKTGGSSAGIFTFSGSGYDIEPVGEPRNPHKRFNPSQCSFTMLMDPGNSAHTAFINDLKSAPENRFYVKAYHNGFLDFAGPVKMDAVRYTDVPTVFDFTIVASDGISGTSGIDYSNAGAAYTGRATIMEHVINVLQKIGVDDLYGGDDAVTVVVNWYADEMPNKGIDNPWDMANVDHELFIRRGEDGSPDFMKCMEVLDILFKPFHACLRYGQGRYWIEQIQARTSATFVGWTYSLDGTLRQVQTWNLDSLVEQNKANWRQSKFSLRDREYNFLPPLREVNVNFTYDEDYAAYAKDVSWNSNSLDVCGPETLIIPYNDEIIIRVAGQLRVRSEVDNTELFDNGWTPHRYFFRMRISVIAVGPWVLQPRYFEREIDSTDFYNLVTPDGVWGDFTEVKDIDLITPVIQRADNARNTYIPVVFETKPIEVSAGLAVTHKVCFELIDVLDPGLNALNAFYTTDWSFENVEVGVIDPDAAEGKAKSRTLKLKGSSNTDNTAVLPIDTILGDNASAKNSILVYDGSEYVKPTMWGVGSGGGTHDSILKLLIDEVLSIRTKPLEIAAMAITGSGYTMLTTGRYTWQGVNYLFDVGNKNSQRNTMRGDYFGLSKVPSSSVITNVLIVNKVDTYATRQTDNGAPVDIPPLDNEGISIIDAPISEGDTVTTISIPAAAYNYFRTGDVIEVRDPGTGNKQKFTVSADVNKGDTSISVNSVAAAATLGEESKVIFDWAYESGQTYNETKERYEFFSVDEGNVLAGATELTITQFALPPSGTPIEQARKRVRAQRNGTYLRLVPDVASYTGQQPMRVFSLDPLNSKIKLHSTAQVGPWDEFDIWAFEIVK